MTYNEQINREENVSREDVLVSSALTTRINDARRALRTGQAPTNQELHDLLGDCALLLSDAVWANRENQVRKLIVGRVMSQFSFAEVPVSPMEEAPAIMAVRAAASVATAAA